MASYNLIIVRYDLALFTNIVIVLNIETNRSGGFSNDKPRCNEARHTRVFDIILKLDFLENRISDKNTLFCTYSLFLHEKSMLSRLCCEFLLALYIRVT